MPGSPPISVAEPGTKPPPATRSSSTIPLTTRGSGAEAPERVFERKGSAHAAVSNRRASDAERSGFLDDRVPLAAGFAFALPTLRDGPAVLTDIRGTKFGHPIRVAASARRVEAFDDAPEANNDTGGTWRAATNGPFASPAKSPPKR